MICERCGRESAPALFCTWCGTRQGAPDRTAAGRRADRFAAHPNEGVVNPAVFTTLFPHLAHRQIDEYRWAMVLGAIAIAILAFAGLITAAILMGAILVPVVYVLYLYEVRVYRDAPVQVLGLTIGGGVAVGIVVTLVIDSFAGTTPLIQSTPFGLDVALGDAILFLVAVPILLEIVKPLPALFLRRSGAFPETIDGVVFGVAAGLGFAAAETIVHFSAVLTSGSIQTDAGTWIYPVATITLFMPLLHGSTTGLITGAVWQLGKQRLGSSGAAAIAAALLAHIAFVVGTALANGIGAAPIVAIAWQAIVVGAVLVAVRLFLHRALLEEATSLGLSQTVCANCDSGVSAAGFCPVCGMAMTAVPRAARRGPQKPGHTTQAEGA
jgi:RsiW-degrading membrane proteinase PrsW (M82 family)